MPDLTVERSLLCAAREPEDLQRMLRSGATADKFTQLAEPAKFLFEYYEKNLVIPTLEILTEEFPDVAWQAESGFDYWLDRFIQMDTYRAVTGVLEKQVPKLREKPTEALDALRRDLGAIGGKERAGLYLTDREALDRLARYRHRVINRRRAVMVDGIPTGLVSIDSKGIGWQKGELVGVVAATTVGKTWLATYFACVAWHAGHRVLFVTPEMNREDIAQRADVILMHLDGHEMSLTALQEGRKIDSKIYEEHLERMARREDWATVDLVQMMSLSTSDINAWVREHGPDIVVVDGLGFLLISGEELWSQVKDVSYSLKSLAESLGVVVILSNQATRDVRGDKIPRLNQCAFGQGFAHACDKIIGMANNMNSLKQQKVYRMEKNRLGVPILENRYLSWDVDVGNIAEVDG